MQIGAVPSPWRAQPVPRAAIVHPPVSVPYHPPPPTYRPYVSQPSQVYWDAMHRRTMDDLRERERIARIQGRIAEAQAYAQQQIALQAQQQAAAQGAYATAAQQAAITAASQQFVPQQAPVSPASPGADLSPAQDAAAAAGGDDGSEHRHGGMFHNKLLLFGIVGVAGVAGYMMFRKKKVKKPSMEGARRYRRRRR